MNTQVIPERDNVADYVRRVREALSDLPLDDVDDLVQGMEADLVEVAEEASGSLLERLGTPEAYAAELRSAAGLPDRQALANDGWWSRTAGGVRADLDRRRTDHPALAAALHRLAPLWWVLRGATLGWLLAGFTLGYGGLAVLVAVAGVALSVAAGLRADRVGAMERRTWRVLSVLAVIGLVPMTAVALSWIGQVRAPAPADWVNASGSLSGLSQEGQLITQLYAYDREGRRLDDVRIYDQNGRPVVVDSGGDRTLDQWVDASGRTWANVYPGRTFDGQGWTVDPQSGAWHPPMAISPLTTRIPSPLDVSPDASSQEGSWDPAAPTEVSPSPEPTATATVTTPATTSTGTTRPTPSRTATNR